MNATREEWRPVVGFEGRYEVSSFGRVRSLNYPVRAGRGTRIVNGRILCPTPHVYHRYLQVTLGRRGNRKVHHVVLEAFVGPRPDGLEGCHNDGDLTNNRADNLRWDTHGGNVNDTVRHGTHGMASKTECHLGHPFTDENTYVHPVEGGRRCRTCRVGYTRAYQQRQLAKRR